MRERNIEAHLRARVLATGGITRKAQWIGQMGCPDRWCGWPHNQRSGWVELKGKGGRLSRHQINEIARLKACGQRVDLLDTIEQVDAYVEEMSN